MVTGGGRDKRRAPRIRMREGIGSRVYAQVDARVVDLSAGGALLEHGVPIPPGCICELVLKEGREELRLHCRIQRSTVTRAERAQPGNELRYQTGLEFLGLTPAQELFLDALLRRHGGGRVPKAQPDITVFFNP